MPQRLALYSLAIAVLVILIKLGAWHLTGSVALLSDALETVVNVVSAAMALWAIHVAHTPADDEHPYGHHKAEYLSAVAVGVIIVLTALLIGHQAWQAWWHPTPITQPLAGFLLNSIAGLINGVWAWLLIRTGRTHRSPALVAEGAHLNADVATSLGVLAGLALVPFTGWLWLDAALAGLVAIHVLWAGTQVIAESMDNLLDRALTPKDLTTLKNLLAEHAKGALEIHALKTRQAGHALFVEFHLVAPGDWTLSQTHTLCDKLESEIMATFPHAHVTIHPEPEHEATLPAVPVL